MESHNKISILLCDLSFRGTFDVPFSVCAVPTYTTKPTLGKRGDYRPTGEDAHPLKTTRQKVSVRFVGTTSEGEVKVTILKVEYLSFGFL